MPLTYVAGDPTLTDAQVLAFGHNRRGRTELGDLETSLLRQNPTAFAMYRRQCKQERVKAGDYWMWRDAKPVLLFMVVRESSVGATRLRHVQSAVLKLARDYHRENIRSVAIAPLGIPSEWGEIKHILETWLGRLQLPVIVYDRYLPDVKADEALSG